MFYKRDPKDGPFPYHNKDCPLEWKKPAIYCEACKGGSSQMDFFESKNQNESKPIKKLDPERAAAEAKCVVGAGVSSRAPKMEEYEETDDFWANEFPERNLPIPGCVGCKQPYDKVKWLDEQTVRAWCTRCGDRSRQKCPKSFIQKGYRWK